MNALRLKATRRSAHRIHLSVPHMGGRELQYVQEAFTSNWLSTVGPNLDALERDFSRLIDMPVVAVSSGTAALHLALRLVGVQAGDEVVAPTLTFVATCNPILYEHARPVLIDSERRTWNMDPDLLASFLEKRAGEHRLPRAVIVAHLFGQCAEIAAIADVCRRFDVPLIEDAAEALGSHAADRLPGTVGDIGVFSFNGNKIITSTGGGILASPRQEWVDRARHMSTQARDDDPSGTGNYIHSELGFNYRMSNVLAGIGRGQLEVLSERVQQRRAVFERYVTAFAGLPGIEPQPEAEPGHHSRWLSCFLIDEQRFGMSAPDLVQFLETANIQARPVWKPMHLQPLYSMCERAGGSVAEDLNQRAICLPSSSNLPADDQQLVVDLVREAVLSRAATG